METQEIKKPNGAPPPAMEETPKRSLVRKLSEVMAAVGRVAKNGRNSFHNYDYVTETDLADALRGELSKRQVFIFPNVKSCVRSPLEVETTKWIRNEPVANIRKTQLTEIEVDWTFEDGESGETRTVTVNGVGEDNVDKGFYKAFTGSEKYLLMKAFLIATGDDPEAESKHERQEVKRQQKQAAKKVAEEKIAGTFEQSAQIAADKSALFFTWPEEHNGHKAYVFGTNDVLKAHKEALLHAGHWSNRLNAFVIDGEKFDDLKYVLEQLGVTFKKLQEPKPNA